MTAHFTSQTGLSAECPGQGTTAIYSPLTGQHRLTTPGGEHPPNKSEHLSVALVIKMKEVPNIEALGRGGGAEEGWRWGGLNKDTFLQEPSVSMETELPLQYTPSPPGPPSCLPTFLFAASKTKCYRISETIKIFH